MKTDAARGHLAAFVTILIWGTTFISTKVLLRVFAPIEILLIRFAIGYGALWCARPRGLKTADKKQELYFAAAGLCGIALTLAGLFLSEKRVQSKEAVNHGIERK